MTSDEWPLARIRLPRTVTSIDDANNRLESVDGNQMGQTIKERKKEILLQNAELRPYAYYRISG